MQARQSIAVVRGFCRYQPGLNITQVNVPIQDIVDRQPIEGIDFLAHVGNSPGRR